MAASSASSAPSSPPYRQESVITVWMNGEWKLWGAVDAYYAQDDTDYLVTISLKQIEQAQKEELDMQKNLDKTGTDARYREKAEGA